MARTIGCIELLDLEKGEFALLVEPTAAAPTDYVAAGAESQVIADLPALKADLESLFERLSARRGRGRQRL